MRERAIALAGVMGGAETEVDDVTRDLLIESAHFDPGRVRRSPRAATGCAARRRTASSAASTARASRARPIGRRA